jgi:hypothetical protein
MADVTSPGQVQTFQKVSCYDMYFQWFVENAAQLYPGCGVACMPDGGLAPADTAGALFTVGRAAQSVLGTGSSGPNCQVDQGIFRWQAGTNAPTVANRGQICYWQDDQTVTMTPGTLPAGTVEGADSLGVWVLTGLGLQGNFPSPIILTMLISTATGGAYYMPSPVAGTITLLQTSLQAAITTGNAVVTGKIGSTAITTGVVTIIESGSAAGQVNSAAPTAANVVSVGSDINFAITGTASTQNALLSVTIQPASA